MLRIVHQKIKTITIIGSKGEMGKIFKSSFQKQGLRVIEIEQKTPFSKWESLLADSQMIIVSVPIEKTPSVVQKILPYLKPHQILSDFTSVKKELFVLFKKTQSAVISAHPMFGKIEKIQAQKILLLPIKEKGYLKSVSELYKKLGLKVQIIKDWENHDEYMSAIQGLLHFSQIALVKTLRTTNLDLKTMLSICSPIYSITFAVACRILMRNPELYMHILMDNPNNKPLLKKFITETKNQLKTIENKDSKEFLKEFQMSKDFISPNKTKLKELGDFLIEMTQQKELADK